jgi:hypothetical protein
MNGDYYGKFAVGTTWNKDFLKVRSPTPPRSTEIH